MSKVHDEEGRRRLGSSTGSRLLEMKSSAFTLTRASSSRMARVTATAWLLATASINAKLPRDGSECPHCLRNRQPARKEMGWQKPVGRKVEDVLHRVGPRQRSRVLSMSGMVSELVYRLTSSFVLPVWSSTVDESETRDFVNSPIMSTACLSLAKRIPQTNPNLISNHSPGLPASPTHPGHRLSHRPLSQSRARPGLR